MIEDLGCDGAADRVVFLARDAGGWVRCICGQSRTYLVLFLTDLRKDKDVGRVNLCLRALDNQKVGATCACTVALIPCDGMCWLGMGR